MVEPFQIGDWVLLSNRRTRYGLNNIPEGYWGKEYAVTEVDVYYGANEIAAYYIDIPLRGRQHVVHSMLGVAGGPW